MWRNPHLWKKKMSYWKLLAGDLSDLLQNMCLTKHHLHSLPPDKGSYLGVAYLMPNASHWSLTLLYKKCNQVAWLTGIEGIKPVFVEITINEVSFNTLVTLGFLWLAYQQLHTINYLDGFPCASEFKRDEAEGYFSSYSSVWFARCCAASVSIHNLCSFTSKVLSMEIALQLPLNLPLGFLYLPYSSTQVLSAWTIP